MLKYPPEFVCYQTFRTIRIGPYVTLLLSAALNDLEKHLELDSHADTSCLGGDDLVLTDCEIPGHVQGYDLDLATKTFPTISEDLLYYNPYMGQTYHIVIHQAV